MTHSERDDSGQPFAVLLRTLASTSAIPSLDQIAAGLPRSIIARLGPDAAGWIAWCILGLDFFSRDSQAMTRLRPKARAVILGVAMLRVGGNISRAARMLGMSRRAVRHGLRGVDMYPWPGDDERPMEREP